MSSGKWTAHPVVLSLILILSMVSGRVVSNPGLDLITKITLVSLSLISTFLALLFEFLRMEEK